MMEDASKVGIGVFEPVNVGYLQIVEIRASLRQTDLLSVQRVEDCPDERFAKHLLWLAKAVFAAASFLFWNASLLSPRTIRVVVLLFQAATVQKSAQDHFGADVPVLAE